MKTSPRKGAGLAKKSPLTAPAEPAEQSLIPSHWPETLKILVLLAALWAITLGVFSIIWVLGWISGL